MNVETQITLQEFKLRPYQVPIYNALKDGYRRIIAVLPRRAGKDFLSWNLLIREAIKKPAIYWVVLPTALQARKIYWDGRTNDGKSWLDCIPKELIKSIHQQEMKIILINSSVIQLQGSNDDPDRLVGANCYGVILSEYALINPLVYDQIISPMLNANGGFALFLSTPRGKQGNDLWTKWNVAQNNPLWFSYIQTIDQTQHMSVAEIKQQIANGEIEESLALQEYWCFPGNQEVLMPHALKRIDHIKKNDMVISHSGRPRKVEDVFEQDYCGDLIVIKTYGSYEPIKCTPEHPIRTFDLETNRYSWKKAKDITKEDRLVFPKKHLGNNTFISYELAMLMAWYICEGSAFKNGIQFTIGTLLEANHIGRLLQALKIPFRIRQVKTVFNVFVNGHEIVDFFKINCGLISHNKFISFDLISGYEKEFFYELMMGDGHYREDIKGKKYLFCTTSKTLAYQVQHLAHSINDSFAAGVQYRPPSISKIGTRTIKGKESYSVNIYITEPKLGQQNKLLQRSKLSINAQIRSIGKESYTGKVYNLKVQFDESYLVGGRSVHNCSFDRGASDTFYGPYLDKARMQGRIGFVPHEPGLLVYSSWDIGISDYTFIILFQIAGQTVRIINCYQNHGLGVDHYISWLDEQQKKWGYKYHKHFAPWDIMVREWGAGAITRYEQARQLGITFTPLEQIGLYEGINNCWMNFQKLYFDEEKCKTLLLCLESYRRKYDEIKKIHSNLPIHDKNSHGADAFRYLCQALPLCNIRNSTPQELEKRFVNATNPRGHEPSFTSHRY